MKEKEIITNIKEWLVETARLRGEDMELSRPFGITSPGYCMGVEGVDLCTALLIKIETWEKRANAHATTD